MDCVLFIKGVRIKRAGQRVGVAVRPLTKATFQGGRAWLRAGLSRQTKAVSTQSAISSQARSISDAVSLKRRWKLHRSHLDAGRHHSYTLQREWLEYGSEAFVFEVLEVVGYRNDLTLIEQRYFDQFRPFDSEVGYNISPTAGSPLGTTHGPEFRAGVMAAVRNASPEVRAKRRAAILTPAAQANAIAARHRPQVREDVGVPDG